MLELIRGKDKKCYPADLPRSRAELLRLVALSHTLRCGRKLTYSLVQETLAAEFGVRRSIGAIAKDLHTFKCPLCVDGARPVSTIEQVPRTPIEPTAAPAQRSRTQPVVHQWR